MSRARADLLVTGIDWLLTVDEERRVLRQGAVAVRDGAFVAVGATEAVESEWEADTVVGGARRVAVPGMVDNHLHASFQLSRGLADEVGAQLFLIRRMYPYEAALRPEDVALSSRLAACELLRHGVTAFVDPGNLHPDETIEAVSATGIRMVAGRSVFDRGASAFGSLPEGLVEETDAAIAATESLMDRYAGVSDRIQVSASFRGLNNASDELISGLAALAGERSAVLQTHACFNYSTRDASVQRFGMSEVERLERLGALGPRTLLVHGGWLEPGDLPRVVRSGTTVVAAPSSSVHNGYGNLAAGFAPELLALGANVSLGSDHASSGPVDMTREMFLVACGHKEVRFNARVMPPETALEMATRNGARGAGLLDRCGSVEVGKRADLVLFDTDTPEWQPLYNPVSNLVYSAVGSTVSTVLVDGEVVVDRGRMTRVDEEELFSAVRRGASALFARLGGQDLTTLRWPVSGPEPA